MTTRIKKLESTPVCVLTTFDLDPPPSSKTWHNICNSSLPTDKMVIDMEHKKDEAKLSSSDLTTANYVNDHLLDRVRHLQKTEPTLVKPIFCEDDKKVFVKLSPIDLVS
jgi:hypothetical protein